MGDRRVVVTSIGAVTPTGLPLNDFWDSLTKGKSGVSKATHFDVSRFTSQVTGKIKDFNPQGFNINPKKTKKAVLNKGTIHSTINYENPGQGSDLEYVPNEARQQKVTTALSDFLSFSGHNAAVIS